jgi:hypothetical protein
MPALPFSHETMDPGAEKSPAKRWGNSPGRRDMQIAAARSGVRRPAVFAIVQTKYRPLFQRRSDCCLAESSRLNLVDLAAEDYRGLVAGVQGLVVPAGSRSSRRWYRLRFLAFHFDA